MAYSFFDDDDLEPPAPLPPPPDPPLWGPRDLPIGIGLLLLGYAGVIATFVLLARGIPPDETPDVAIGAAFASLGFTVWLGAIVMILATRRGLSLHQLGFRAPTHRFGWWWITITVVGAYSLAIAYSVVITAIEAATGSDLSRLTEGNIPDASDFTTTVWVIIGISVVVAAPLGEELFFRSFLFERFKQGWGLFAALIVSGGIFALVHFEVSVILPFWAIGVWFAWTYHRSGSLWTTILAHAIFNGLSFAAVASGVQA